MECLPWSILLLLSMGIVSPVAPARILVMTALGTKSTTLMLQNLAENLAMNGHEVVHVTKEQLTSETVNNLSYVYMDPNIKYDEETFVKNLFSEDSIFTAYPFAWLGYYMYIPPLCEPFYNDSFNLRKKFDDTGKFDVILVDFYMQDCIYPLLHTKQAPMIFVHANSIDIEIANALSIPTPYFTRSFFSPAVKEMTFINRLFFSFIQSSYIFMQEWMIFPRIESIVRKFIPHSPPITDILRNVSLIMAADDALMREPRPITPLVVDITCLYCRPAQPLPEAMEKAVQESGENGFIIFATGTFLKFNALPQDFLENFLKAFAKLKQTVIFQFKGKLDNVPENVKIFQWLPTQDLLGHPKCKLLFYHGGMYTTYEAIYHGIPMIGFGVFGDQLTNIRKGVLQGITVEIDKQNLKPDSIYAAINVALQPSYKARVQELSSILRDQPTTPLERTLYWIDYVIRHQGAPHLHSVGGQLTYIQYFYLDLIGYCIIAFLLIPLFLFVGIKMVLWPMLNYSILHI